MADIQGVEIRKGKIGANTITTGDGISGLIIATPKPEGTEYGKVLELFNLTDALNLEITSLFDEYQGVHLYRHISEYFRIAGEGQKLYLMLVPGTVTMQEICEDTDNQYAKKILIEAKGEIKQLAIGVNARTPQLYLNGLPLEVYNSIALAQALAEWAYTFHFPCQILLEGYDYQGSAASAANLRNLSVQAPKVSIVIGQDWNYADAFTNQAQKLADIGTALGTVAACRINQNMGENESFNLSDALRAVWLVPGLSSHQKNKEVFSDLQTLENKGYIFGVTYTGLAGVRWNNDHTCTPIIRDAEGNVNEHTIAYGRTLDKAVRLLRIALLPEVKKSHPINPKTGLLPIGVIKNFEGIGNTVLGDMVNRKEITDGRMIVDPTSDLIIAKLLKSAFEISPFGVIGGIFGTINLKTNL